MRRFTLVLNAAPAGNGFHRLSTNARSSGSRTASMEGREYRVIPMVILTEGVHEGSMGPLLYSSEEMSKTPASWNHKPIVVYHPTMNGQGISACDPNVIDTRKVGLIMNTKFERTRLTSEAWIEPSRADAVDERIMAAVKAGEMMELSTGVFIDVDPTPGKWGTEEYSGLAKNFRPDHLALLPDQIGACSIQDGAGFLRNSSGRKERGLLTWLGKVFGLVGNEMSYSDTSSQLSDAINAKFNPHDGPRYWVMDVYPDRVIYQAPDGNLYRIGYTISSNVVSIEGDPVRVVFIKTYEDVTAENKVTKTEGGGSYPSSDYLVVEDPEKSTTWHLRVRDHGTINHRLMGAAWAALHEGYRGNKYEGPNKAQALAKLKSLYKSEKMALPGQSNNAMNKEQMLEAIIASNTGWSKTDHDVLLALSDQQVTMIHNSLPKGEKQAEGKEDASAESKSSDKPTSNKETETTDAKTATDPAVEIKPLTLDQYIANAPRGIQEVLSTAVTALNAEKASLVKSLLGNGSCEWAKEDLENKPLAELRRLAKLAGIGATSNRFDGQGVAQNSSQGANTEEPVLVMPTMNFEKK